MPGTDSFDITTTNPVKDWKYVSEGGATIVFSYIGPPNPAYDGMVLRLRKMPNVPVGVRDSDSSSSDSDDDEEEEDDPSISFQRQCMSRLIPPAHLPRLQSISVRMDPVRSASIDSVTGTYVNSSNEMPGAYHYHGPPHIHSNRWLRALSGAHDSFRPEIRRQVGGVDIHKRKGVLATDLVGGQGISVEIKPKWSFLPNPNYLSPETKPIKTQTCRFCMHSFVRARAGETVSLGYCPLDLFSPDEAHVRKAVHALWDAWDASRGKVNNLKVFVKGKMLSVDEKHLLLASSHSESDSKSTEKADADIREIFTSAILPLLTQTPVLQTLNRLQRTLDMLDIEGLSKLWEKWHETTPDKPIPHIGQDTLEPTLDEWNRFIDGYLSQPPPASSSEGGEPTLPVIETEYQLRKYLLAYLLSATFKDCSIIIRMDLLSPGADGQVRVDSRRVTVIDLDPKSMTRLRKWEELDAEIISAYRAGTEDGKAERKKCVDGWSE
ncbi:hypothetical protein Moror_11280 [Moniliophthora roreri MCA 2997]|uniref:Inositol-pentakisphosphate 2-kinase n=1 Tax=Moniliophthora roreri (strain MCA 2997) TaxID=1381753 RepID=V2WLM9_MONRO|nr:hypothetical protein Moror_11280 [Moniliophthora roreri MCA 2997]